MPSNKQNTTDIQLRVSEKAGDLRGLNQFVFVIKNALNKSEVKKQIEKKYKVNVIGMNIVRIAKKNLKKAIFEF
ncbi:MAG: 50S ribosomal protein L23, partial [Patescibacteria group bacterium]|nr:50S ribosomal protein L23 [Patescibacteria group bacterium]